MKTLDITVVKAKLISFYVIMEKDEPAVIATIGLFSANDKKIAEYALQTNHWNKELKFDLPFEMVFPIKELSSQLEEIVAAHCQGSMKMLGSHAEVL